MCASIIYVGSCAGIFVNSSIGTVPWCDIEVMFCTCDVLFNGAGWYCYDDLCTIESRAVSHKYACMTSRVQIYRVSNIGHEIALTLSHLCVVLCELWGALNGVRHRGCALAVVGTGFPRRCVIIYVYS